MADNTMCRVSRFRSKLHLVLTLADHLRRPVVVYGPVLCPVIALVDQSSSHSPGWSCIARGRSSPRCRTHPGKSRNPEKGQYITRRVLTIFRSPSSWSYPLIVGSVDVFRSFPSLVLGYAIDRPERAFQFPFPCITSIRRLRRKKGYQGNQKN